VLPGGKSMLATYGPDAATGKRQLQMTSDDAGALLRTFHAVDTVVGGNLTVQGEAKDATPGAPILATVRITDYRVVRGPVMAQILAKAKLEDINKKLANEGIAFAHFTGKLGFGEDAIVIDKARAYGPLLGITARGRLDLKRNLMDVEGTIVPAYIVSEIIGEIPLIGRVITGGEGEGVFAATYTARGTLDDPQVSVNPLAALAPGFLRGLFNMLSSGSGNELDFTPLPQPSQK